MIRVGIIGYGYWGPVVARNFQSADRCQLAAICDASPAAQERARKAHPGIQITGDPSDLLRSPQIDAIAVITPVWTHFEFAKAALENGKHVFVEKPVALDVPGIKLAMVLPYLNNTRAAELVAAHYGEPLSQARAQVAQVEQAEINAGF